MREKDKWLQVRMEDFERDAVDELAASYNVSTSLFVRMATDHIARTRPTLSIYPILPPEDVERFRAAWEKKVAEVRQRQAEDEKADMLTATGQPRKRKPKKADEMKPRGWLQIRMSAEELEHLTSVAADYGVDTSKFVRVVLGYFREVRPKMELAPMGKDYALAA